MAFTYLYSKEATVIKEGDEITIFGLLTYNTKSDEFRFDDPLGFIQGNSRSELLSRLSKQAFGEIFNVIWSFALGACFLATSFWLTKKSLQRFKELRIER